MIAHIKALSLIFSLSLFCLAISKFSYSQISQPSNAFTEPTSNNLFLGRNGPSSEAVSVDLYTGVPIVNIPICHLPGKQLDLPISLVYTSGRGVRLQDYATQAGLGWQLNAGGNVSRVVRGYPDESANGYIAGGWGNILDAAAGNTASLSSTQQSQLAVNSASPPTVDGEPDLFNVVTPFFSFQFTLDGNGKAIVPNNNGFKVQWVGYSSFVVTDDQGNQYYFGSSSNSVEQTSSTIYGSPATFTTTWYLDRIVTFNSAETITLGYTSYSSYDYNYHYCTTFAFDNGEGKSNTYNSTLTNAVISPKYVTSITSAQGQINFTYQLDRYDDPFAARLSGISVVGYNPMSRSNSSVLSSYTFNYSYLGAPSTDTNVLRLCLNNITVSGNTTATTGPLTLYTFTYNTANVLPSRQSQNFDNWGYYDIFNPTTANPMVTPSVRQPNLAATMAGVLTGVGDLEGETWTIGYELNTYYSGGNVAIGGLRANKISKTWNGTTLSTLYDYNDNSGNSTGQIFNTINPGGVINPLDYTNLTYFEAGSSNELGENFSESPYLSFDQEGNFVGYSAVKVTNPDGSYMVSQFTNFNTVNCQDVTLTNGNQITVTSSKAYKRGLPIEKTLYTAAGNKVSDDVYNYSTLNSAVTSTGWGVHWQAINYAVTWCKILIGGTCVSQASESVSNAGPASSYAAYQENYRLTSAIHKDYDEKTAASYLTSTTSYTYDQLSDPVNTNRLVSGITTTDSKSQTHTRNYYYSIDVGQTGTAAIPMLTAGEISALNAMVTANNTGTIVHSRDSRNGTTVQVHHTYSEAVNNHLYLTTSSTYKNDAANSTVTPVDQQFFTYDPGTSNPISTNSAGGYTTAAVYDYNSALPTVKVQNASSQITATATTSSFSYTVPNGTATSAPSYPVTVVANGSITVALVWPSLPASGSANTASVTFSISGPAGFTPVNTTICISSNFTCSGYVNQVTYTYPCVPGSYTVLINGSQNPESNFTLFQVSYPRTLISTISNEFFYDGFEQDGNNPYAAHTGNMCYSGSYTVPYTPPNGRSYLIQWWSYSNGAWVFNQQNYTASMALPGQIDDVRVFPSDALMTTYTYNPLVGKTSEIDPSGKAIIYQYDGLNRLSTIRDLDNNILRQYDYEFQACATPVYSAATSGTYFRNNCSAGLYGSEVTYTVPAGKYSACTVAAANQLAANDVNYYGQNYANATGSCGSTPPCVAPINIGVSVSSATLTVTWTYPPGAGTNAYAVIVKNAATGAAVFDDYGTGSPTYVTSGLAYNTTYTVSVLSLCGSDPGSAPITVTTGGASAQSVNLTNGSTPPSGFCCHGCSYTSSVYSSTPAIGPGTALYTDANLTIPLSGYNWIFPYANNTSNVSYLLNGNIVESTTAVCQ